MLGGAIAATLVWWLVPVNYEAFALLRVAGKPPVVLGELGESGAEEFAVFKRTQVELIRSGTVLTGTLRDTGVNKLSMVREHRDDPVKWLSEQLIIDYPNDAEVLRIAMKGTQPAELAEIVNRIVASYLKEVVQHEKEVRNAERTRLERAQVARIRDLTVEMDALHKMEQVTGVATSESVQLEKRLAADQLVDLMAERRELVRDLRRNKLQVMLAEARKKRLKMRPQLKHLRPMTTPRRLR